MSTEKKSEFDTPELVKSPNVEEGEDYVVPENVELMTDAQIEKELKMLELKTKRFDLILKKDRSAQAEARINQKREEFFSKMRSLKEFIANREATQSACNHRKGARGVDGVMRRQGQSAMYSIIRHWMPDGTIWAICQNCQKEWTPGKPDYENAGFNWPTDNETGGSVRFNIVRNR